MEDMNIGKMKNNLQEERQMITKVLEVLIKVSETKGEGSVSKKKELLKSLQDDGSQEMYLIYLLKTAFDPFWVTHINRIEVDMFNTYVTDFDIVKLVEELKSVKAVNYDLRMVVMSYVNSYPFEYRQMLVDVLTKTMNAGIGIKQINGAFVKEVIRDVEIMKAEKGNSIVQEWFDEGEEVWAEMKYDGIRAFAEMNEGKCMSIKTYNFSEFDLSKTTHMVEQLEKLAVVWDKCVIAASHFFFDFEITGRDRQSVGGEINSLIKGGKEIGCDKNWMMNIFDVHPWYIFEGKKASAKYVNRRDFLERIYEETVSVCELRNVLIAERWQVMSIGKLMELFEKVLQMGCEGLICKKGSGVYELRRSLNWIKMKAERECDLRILGWYDGSKGTKRFGKIGGFVCQSEDGLLQVNVGGGFTDKIIEEIVQNGQDSYKGKIIKVLYNSVISKQDSEIKSLFLPRLARKDWFRFDKNIADSLTQILKK